MFNRVRDVRKAEIDCYVRMKICPAQFVCGKCPLFAKWKMAGGRHDLHTSSLNRAGKEGTRRALAVSRQQPPFREAFTDGFSKATCLLGFLGMCHLTGLSVSNRGQNPSPDASLHPLTSLAAMLRDILRPFFFGL